MPRPAATRVQEFTASRMSFSHPEPERAHGSSSSQHFDDAAVYYRPEPPSTRMDGNLMNTYSGSGSANDFLQSLYPFGSPPTHFQMSPTSAFSGGFRYDAGQSSSMPDNVESTEADDGGEGQPIMEAAAVERRVQPPRHRRARHCCSTPRDRRAPRNN